MFAFNRLPAVLLAFCLSVSAALGDDSRFEVKGEVTGVADSALIVLYEDHGNLLTPVVSDTIVGGRFSLTGTIEGDRPVRRRLMVDGNGFPSRFANVWIAPGKTVEITGDGPFFELWNIKSELPQQQSENSLTESLRPLLVPLLGYQTEEKALIRHLYVELQGAEEYMKPIWTQIDSIRVFSNPLEDQVTEKTLDWLASAPIDEAWYENFEWYAQNVTKPFMSSLAPKIREIGARLTADMLATPEGSRIGRALAMKEPLKTGDMMDDATLYDVSGNSHTLAEFGGKCILLDFWSMGCGPCKAAAPELEEIAAEMADRLAVVSISTDPGDVWRECVAARGLKGNQWNELVDPGMGLSQRYGVSAIPHFVFIGEDGKIRSMWTGYGAGELRRLVTELLGK